MASRKGSPHIFGALCPVKSGMVRTHYRPARQPGLWSEPRGPSVSLSTGLSSSVRAETEAANRASSPAVGMQPHPTGIKSPYDKHAVVVGAGPAGALSALLLAQQGIRVDVFERSELVFDVQGKAQASIGPRSYNLLLTERAAVALEQAGADLSEFDAPEVSVMMRHR